MCIPSTVLISNILLTSDIYAGLYNAVGSGPSERESQVLTGDLYIFAKYIYSKPDKALGDVLKFVCPFAYYCFDNVYN